MARKRRAADMTPEELEEVRRLDRRRKKLAVMGRPMTVLPHEYQAARRKLAYLHDERGLSYEFIGQSVGGAGTTIRTHCRGRAASMRRSTWERIMRFDPDVTGLSEVPTYRSGAEMPVIPIRRRLQGMIADGFDGQWIADQLGLCKESISKIVRPGSPRTYLLHSTADAVRRLYDKYENQSAEDVVPKRSYRTGNGGSRTAALRKGWAPRACWDPETIDDPDAIPDWTGACGTPLGYKRHLRAGVGPLTASGRVKACEPCREAHLRRKVELKAA